MKYKTYCIFYSLLFLVLLNSCSNSSQDSAQELNTENAVSHKNEILGINNLNEKDIKEYFSLKHEIDLDTFCGYTPEFIIGLRDDQYIESIKLFVECHYYTGSIQGNENQALSNEDFDKVILLKQDSALVDGNIISVSEIGNYLNIEGDNSQDQYSFLLRVNRWDIDNGISDLLETIDRKGLLDNNSVEFVIEYRNKTYNEEYEKILSTKDSIR